MNELSKVHSIQASRAAQCSNLQTGCEKEVAAGEDERRKAIFLPQFGTIQSRVSVKQAKIQAIGNQQDGKAAIMANLLLFRASAAGTGTNPKKFVVKALSFTNHLGKSTLLGAG